MKRFFLVLSIFFLFVVAEGCLCASNIANLLGLNDMDVADYSGSWHSAYPCVESETEPYKWGVTLVEEEDDQVSGTIYFHRCPGGGAVTYAVYGKHIKGEVPLRLEGIISGGRGDLFENAPATQIFNITYKQPPDPNLSQ